MSFLYDIVSSILHDKMYKVKGSIWVEKDNGAFIGAGRVKLLEGIKKMAP